MKPVYDRWDVFSVQKRLSMQSYKNLKMRVGAKCSSHLVWVFFFFFPPSVEESELSVDPCISPTTVFLFFYHSTFVFFLSFQTPFHPLQKVSAFFFCPAIWVRLGACGSCFCRKGHGGCCLATACLILDVPVE